MAYKKLKYWFDKGLVTQLAEKLSSNNSAFNKTVLIHNIESKLDFLELKGRVELIADQLHNSFEQDYNLGLPQLINILGPENSNETGMFTEYYWVMPIAKYVEKYGLNDFEKSMNALEEITKRNTSEYAIRPYILHHFDKTLKQMVKWSKHSNFHIRRLASEGVRPRLPWAKKLDVFIQDPSPITPILENLKDDTSKYVQKSVANCLNDILKDNFSVGKEIVESWNQEEMTTERQWIVKHALRNLIKTRDDWAIKMIK